MPRKRRAVDQSEDDDELIKPRPPVGQVPRPQALQAANPRPNPPPGHGAARQAPAAPVYMPANPGHQASSGTDSAAVRAALVSAVAGYGLSYMQQQQQQQQQQQNQQHAAASSNAIVMAAMANQQQTEQTIKSVRRGLLSLDSSFGDGRVEAVLARIRQEIVSKKIDDDDDALARAVEIITENYAPPVAQQQGQGGDAQGQEQVSQEEKEREEAERKDMDIATEMALTSAAEEKHKREKDERRLLVAADLMREDSVAETALKDCSLLKTLRSVACFKAVCAATVGLEESAKKGGPASRAKLGVVGLCQLAAKARKWYGVDAAPYITEVGDKLASDFTAAGGSASSASALPQADDFDVLVDKLEERLTHFEEGIMLCRTGLPKILLEAGIRAGVQSNESIGALDEDGCIILDD